MSAVAKVKFEVEVRTGGGSWQDTETVEHIRKVAARECTNFLSNLLITKGDGRIKIIGEPVVTVVLLPPDK